MKKNNSFRITFYLGLFIILITVSFLTLVIVNVWRAFEPKLKKEEKEKVVITEQYSLDVEKIHDTIFIEKITPTVIDIPKVVKKQTNFVKTKDTTISVDTIK